MITMLRLYETYLDNIKNVPNNAFKMIITRSREHPLSPSWQLLMDYKNNKIDWNEYIQRFYQEMNNSTSKQKIAEIEKLSLKNDVYLICIEPNPDNNRIKCHRFLIMDMIKNGFHKK